MGDIFKAIADSTRRTILDELTERDDQTLFEICSRLATKHGLGSTRQALSQQIAQLLSDGIPFNSFMVEDVHAEHERVSALGVRFTQAPVDLGTATTAVFEDTCGNLIAIAQPNQP